MSSVKELNEKYGIKDRIVVEEGVNGFPKVKITLESGTSAEIYLYGAHLTSFKTETGKELIFMSSKAIFKEEKAIRGGVPIIFPQFGGGPLPQHGFGRNSKFDLLETSVAGDSNSAKVVLALHDNASTRKVWNHAFELKIIAELSFHPQLKSKLRLSMDVTNKSNEGITFTSALHTYFKVDDVEKVAIRSLKNLEYLDKVTQKKEKEHRDEVTISSETDSVYHSAPDHVTIIDGETKISITKHNFSDYVIWNPHKEKCTTIADMGTDDWKTFVCVEAAAVNTPVVLKSNDTWHAYCDIHIQHNFIYHL
jgi:glucose-6-phosphate 1-epimerase